MVTRNLFTALRLQKLVYVNACVKRICVITMAHHPALNSDQMRSEFLKNLTMDVTQYIRKHFTNFML